MRREYVVDLTQIPIAPNPICSGLQYKHGAMREPRNSLGNRTDKQSLNAAPTVRGHDDQTSPYRFGMLGDPMTGITKLDTQLQVSTFGVGERFLKLFERGVTPFRMIDRCPQCIWVRRLLLVKDSQDVNTTWRFGDL